VHPGPGAGRRRLRGVAAGLVADAAQEGQAGEGDRVSEGGGDGRDGHQLGGLAARAASGVGSGILQHGHPDCVTGVDLHRRRDGVSVKNPTREPMQTRCGSAQGGRRWQMWHERVG